MLEFCFLANSLKEDLSAMKGIFWLFFRGVVSRLEIGEGNLMRYFFYLPQLGLMAFFD